MLQKNDVLEMLWEYPIEIGHCVGFRDLGDMHNEWLKMFLYADKDITLQGHRGSYKTTVLSLFLAIHAVIEPQSNVMLFRKTDTDVKEVLRQTAKILSAGVMDEITKTLYNRPLKLLRQNYGEITTNLGESYKGVSQIVGLGIGTSITGKHADIVVTDDIVNVKDRKSAAEREATKLAYQELENVKNRGGRFINTGTPWHKEDAFLLMPNPIKYDCYSTGLMTQAQIDDLKMRMAPSLFAANYELRHIASEDVIFPEPERGANISNVLNSIAHVDAAFYGEDYTAFSIMSFHDGKFYVYGRMWRKHVEDCYTDILNLYNNFLCTKLFIENNADKGMVARDLRRLGIKTSAYTESTNKYIKIVTYLKAIWPEVVFVEGTDPGYIEQITDYTETAEHDDAPDSAACLARLLYRKSKRRTVED